MNRCTVFTSARGKKPLDNLLMGTKGSVCVFFFYPPELTKSAWSSDDSLPPALPIYCIYNFFVFTPNVFFPHYEMQARMRKGVYRHLSVHEKEVSVKVTYSGRFVLTVV